MFFRSIFILFAFLSSPVFAYQVGDTLPPATQKQLHLDDQQVAIVDFFAQWCVSCRAELPEVNTLAEQLKKSGCSLCWYRYR